MNSAPQSFWWAAHTKDLPNATGWTVVDKNAFQEKDHDVTGGHLLPHPVPSWADDLFCIARAVFLADKRARREREPDEWTRRIGLSVPVAHPGHWGSPPAVQHLTTLLQALTADTWEVTFRDLEQPHFVEPLPGTDPEPVEEVALFSGGLDSLSWAAQRVRANPGRPPLLVMFRELKLEPLQYRMHGAVQRIAGGAVPLRPINQTPSGDGGPGTLDWSSRTRGLLYAAGAIRAAAAHGVGTVHIPENGQVALNPPLSAARSAALSTRSVHPWTLHHLNGLIAAVVGDARAVQVTNPLAQLTKGEVCQGALDSKLTPSDLAASLSCGRPPTRQPRSSSFANCGICFPCLIRRSGLHNTRGGDETRYEAAPWDDNMPPKSTEHWRALHRWLNRQFTVRDVITDTPLPPGTSPADVLPVIENGRAELQRWMRSASAQSAA